MKAVYLIFNDSPSGVYTSQVADAVNFLNERKVAKIRLVAFVSIRSYRRDQRKIHQLCPGAIVVPMFPGVKNWNMNVIPLFFLLLFLQPKTIIARGIFATRLADQCRSVFSGCRLVFDARGAYFAEFNEHQLIDDAAFVRQVKKLEALALKNSDSQLSVSDALTSYWRKEYAFDATQTAEVIPCTLAEMNQAPLIPSEVRNKLRLQNGVQRDDCVLVYSGSAAGWQSLDHLFHWLARVMKANDHVRVLLLTPMKAINHTALAAFSDRIILRWVTPAEVPPLMAIADYGLLLRRPDITNSVASPTKFAEYLASGLQVLISPGIGDFTSFTQKHQCGLVIEENQIPSLRPLLPHERNHSREISENFFRKSQYLKQYQTLIYGSENHEKIVN